MKERINVFSPALEVVLTIAYREAVSRRPRATSRSSTCSTRSRTTPTASGSSPRAAPICRGCGATSTPISTSRIEQLKRGQRARAGADGGVPPRAADGGAARAERAAQEVQVGDILAAILQQPKTHAAQLLAEQGVTRLDILEYISHGITQDAAVRARDRRRADAPRATPAPATTRAGRPARDPLARLLRRT